MVPITFGELIPTVIDDTHQNIKKMSITSNDVLSTPRYVKILMDSNTSASIIHEDLAHINKFNTRETSTNKWSTMYESFSTLCEAKIVK